MTTFPTSTERMEMLRRVGRVLGEGFFFFFLLLLTAIGVMMSESGLAAPLDTIWADRDDSSSRKWPSL